MPFLVLLALETGLEIECCKELTVDCLQNASNGTVEISYLKRRERGAEHKRLRVRDGGPTTPGGMIRRLIEVTARARRRHPSQCLWVYCGAGVFAAGIGHPQELVDSWTRRHDIVDDDGRPLRLLLSHLRKTHKALWYLKTEGHMARFAVGHTPEVAARHYADVPALRPLHETTVADAFREAVNSAAPIVLTEEQEAAANGSDAGFAHSGRVRSDRAPRRRAGRLARRLRRVLRQPAGSSERSLSHSILGLPRMLERGDHRP